ncbi:MAG: hypothetical protein ACFFAS_10465 [Promethearchaeota archaeon]
MGSKKKVLKLMEFSRLVSRRICLKCRRSIEKYHYVCPNCGGLYCQYCPDSLKRNGLGCIYCKDPIVEEFNYKEVHERIQKLSSKSLSSLVVDPVEREYFSERKTYVLCKTKVKGLSINMNADHIIAIALLRKQKLSVLVVKI